MVLEWKFKLCVPLHHHHPRSYPCTLGFCSFFFAKFIIPGFAGLKAVDVFGRTLVCVLFMWVHLHVIFDFCFVFFFRSKYYEAVLNGCSYERHCVVRWRTKPAFVEFICWRVDFFLCCECVSLKFVNGWGFRGVSFLRFHNVSPGFLMDS